MSSISLAETKDISSSIAQEEGDWIYYLDDVNFGTLSKIKKDGTGYEALLQLKAIEFVKLGDWIYYISSSAYYQGEGELYRIHISGSDKKRLYNGKHWTDAVQNLQYTQGMITFYAGTNYQLDPNTLVVKKLEDFGYHKTEAIDGKLIARGYDKVAVYDLTSDKVSTFEWEDTEDLAFDGQWVYFAEYDRKTHLDTLYKSHYDGSNRSLLLEDVKDADNLQVIGDHLYYICSLKKENQEYDYRQFHKLSLETNGAQPERIFSKVLGQHTKIRSVIDKQVYFKDYQYITFYNVHTKKPTYYSLRNMGMGDGSIAVNEKGNLLFIKDNELTELTPGLKESVLSTNLNRLNESVIDLANGSVVKYADQVVGVKSNRTNIQVIDLADRSLYEINETDDYNLLGLDKQYVYFTGDKDENYHKNLYRLPIGSYDVSKKEALFKVDTVQFFDGYVIDQKVSPEYLLTKFNLETLTAEKINSHFIYGADVHKGNLYYVKGNNGGIYKTPLTSNKVSRVYSNSHWASEVVVSDSHMYIGTWKGSIQFARTDLKGKNLEALTPDTVDYFIDENQDYVMFVSSFKYARATEGTSQVELLNDLQVNPKPASLEGSSVFYDVRDTDWYASNLYKLVDAKILSGNNGYFRPTDSFTVDQFLTTLCITLHGKVEGESSGYWAQKYIDRAIKEGYITKGQFEDYSAKISRGDIAKIAANALKLADLDATEKDAAIGKIADFEDIQDPYKDSILKVYSKGILSGYGDKSFKPENYLSRAEASAVLAKIKAEVQE